MESIKHLNLPKSQHKIEIQIEIVFCLQKELYNLSEMIYRIDEVEAFNLNSTSHQQNENNGIVYTLL